MTSSGGHMQSRIGWSWTSQDKYDPVTESHVECWVTQVPGLRYPDGAPVIIDALHVSSGWIVGDNRGAFDSSVAPSGVIGTLLSHLDDFIDVQMSGDCYFYVEVADLPKRTLTTRIEHAANMIAAYSVLLAHIHAPPGWPPHITIVMTREEAAQHGIHLPKTPRRE